MATPSHALAVKSLNKSPGRRRFVFKSVSQRLDDIDINVFRSLDKVKTAPSEEGGSFLRDCLYEWRELNTAEDFISLYVEIVPFVDKLPSVLYHKELIFSKLISRLQMRARLSLEPILSLIAVLSRDLLEDFLPFLPRIVDSLVSLLESGADREPEIVEQIFTSWFYIMMYLQKYLIRDLTSVLKVTLKLRYYPKDYVQEFMAEATSFLLRKDRKQLKSGIRKIMLEVVKKPSPERKSGVSGLLYHVMRGAASRFHSEAEQVLRLLLSNSILSIGDKLNQGSDVVEVVISAFQRICDSFEPKELHLMSECLYQEIIDCIANGCLLHLSNLLSLRIATIQIDKGFKVPDHQSMLGLVDLLVRTFVIPSGDGKEVDKLSEVIDKVLQLMLCILDGIHRIDDMSTVSDCTSQWAPVFKLRNSSLLTFIRGLLLKDPCILYTFRVHILSAMNDLIETSSEEVICLLLSYSEKLRMNPQYNNLLDGIPEGVVSRICNFLQEEISSLIKIVRGNLLSIKFDETKLALMWGAIRCYAHILDVQTNSSLLTDLIDALDLLIRNDGDLVERFNIFVSPASDSTPCATVLSLLLQALQKIPFVVESRSQRIISLLLEFLGYDSTDLTGVGSFNSDICKGKEWKGVLKEWLNLLKLMRNPKSFYRSQFLKDVLQNRLLDENDAEIQMKVLDCLLMWRDGFLIPYDQHLKNLINSKNLREEVTTWSLSRESVLMEDAHRAYLVPLVIRLLVPKVRKLKTLASRKQASIYHRKALLGFIAQLDVDELPLFFTLLIKSLNIIPKGADVDVFWTTPNYTMDNFHELSFLKYFNIENLAILSWKKSHGFLHVIEDVFGVFDESHIRPFLHLLMGCVVRILVSCTSSIVAAKGGSSSIKDHSSTDLTVHEHDRPVGNDVLTSSAVKQLKDLRSLCLRIISSVLNKYDDHDYGCEFWDLFFKSVKPLVDAFKQEGSSSEKPSSLFSCFLAMSRSHELVSLLYREKNLVPDIFSILSVTTASEAIVSSVLMFIENLLNLDSELGDEDSAINKLLLPNLEALICSMHYRFQSATKRKLLKSSGETEIRIFKLLSKYIKDPSMARKFVDILLPFLVKGVKDSGFSVKILDVLQDIIPVVETGSTKKILNAVCPLLVSVELEMRLSICHLLVELAKADPSVFPVAELVSQLNATSSEEMNSLDYDSIVAAYDKIDIDLFHTTEVDYALLILSHCVYDMSSEDLILRKSAQRIMLLFVDFSSLILDGEKCNGHESTRIVEGSWTITSIQRIMKNFILKHMGEAMNSGSKVKKEWIDLLREMILKLPQLSNLSSLRDLCSGDTEVDFFNNIIHLQKHRRARALTRFRKVVSASSMPEDLLNKVFVPLFFSMLFDVQDENVRSACSEALASISALMEWKSYSALLIRCFQEMEKNQQKQKILLRLFCSILDQFHFSEICSGQEAKYSLDDALGANTSRTNSSLVDDRSSTIVSEIKTWLHEIMLPKIQKLLNFDSEKVNVDISRAALKLLKLLPGDIMDSQLPSIIHRISNFLKSRSDSMRNSARLSLADCLKELGLEYLKFILGVLRATLKRGYEMHVLGYTLNFILSKNLSNPIGGKLDYCLEDLLSAVKNDILGDVAEEKEVEKIASKMIETKKQKSFETLELIAKNITFKTHALKLLSVVTTHLQMHLTPKTKSKLESMLNHIAAGIDCNQSVDQTDLFVFIYGLIEDRMKEENDLHSSSASTGTNNHKSDAKDKTISSGRVIVAKSACSHLITVFALGLLQKRLKNLRSNEHDEKHLSMLDSFVTLLGNCLSSKYEDVLSASLRCLTSLVSLPLPSLESQADKIKATLLDIAQSSLNSGSPLMQSCLSLLTKLLRSTKITLSSDQLHLLIQFPVFIDLERNPSDVALSLLKAIVSRKLVVHEIYDIVVRVAELMVTSQVESIRKKSSQISLQFLLDYHLSDKRLQQHLDFLLANLSYEHSSGREAVLEMLHAIIKKFPQTKLDEQSHTLFVHLVARLANDHDNKVRSMTGVAIKLLIERINPHMLHSILEYSLSWYLCMKQQLWSAGAQVLGLLVEVMKRNFQRHISAVLPVTRSILQSTINIVRDGQLDLSDEVTIPFWKEAYYSLVLLEKILCQFPDLIFDRDLENIWEAICELMLHPHTWLRNRSNRLIALYFSALTEASKQHQEKARENLFLMKPSRIFMIAVSLCYQLETQLTFDEAFSNRITQNLVSAICTMHSLREQRECIDPHNFWSALGPHEQGLFLKAFKLLESRKGKGIFLSIISSTSDQNDQDQPKDFQFLLVSNLLRKMGKIALQKEAVQMKIVFNSFRLISSEIGPSHCQLYAYQMLPSLYKVCEGFAGKLITDDMKQLAQEVSDSIRNTVGSQNFVQIYNEIRKNLKQKRDKRKQEEKVMAVVNPVRNAKRKLRIAAKHRVNKKRKMMTMKMGRWLR
ncbi:small subunit processome component 20 homolog isoform X1 [Pistacia vera]|uniref:small subunit processome component 20 homolog isoform X1 n=1 Tax=Pistacia vera TaxID=55513 RepID=UPI001263610F|nr:small subunit processome component 20 homolog isoform X1 [Pistacia vera]